MNFGRFDETNMFHIEKSRIYKELGEGIRTVEFVLKYDEKTIVFLEAKKSCPNIYNRDESHEKALKFEEYYHSITDKFISSLQLYIAAVMGRFQNVSEIGDALMVKNDMQDIKFKFLLVIKNAELEWLAGSMAELNARLLKERKIWRAEIAVLNEELAKEYHLITA